MPTRQQFSPSKLRAAIKADPRPREAIALELGIGVAALSHWLTGRNRPNVHRIGHVADVLGLRIEDLFEDVDGTPEVPEPADAQADDTDGWLD